MRKTLVSIIVAVFFMASISSSVLAAMARPRYGINEQTKECSEFFMGDECVGCTFPKGWAMIEDFQCPTGYKEVQKEPLCTPRKNSFCCTLQHSGSSGGCEDVVVNDVEKKCAFLRDINECRKLPQNWEQAEEIEFWGRVCPSWEYEWLDNPLACETKITEENNDNQNEIIDDQQQRSNITTMLGNSAASLFFLIILWLFS